MPLKATVRPWAGMTQILVTQDGDDRLRAQLSPQPHHPRALPTLLEGLSMWLATPVDAALIVDANSTGSSVSDLFGDALLPPDLAQVRFDVRVRGGDRRRLRGPGDFRGLYRLHGDGR